MISAADAAKLTNWNQLSNKALESLLSQNAPTFDRASLGLQKVCANPNPYSSSTTPDESAFLPLLTAMAARGARADHAGSIDQRVTAYLNMLRVSFEGDRGGAAAYSIPAQFEESASLGLWNCRTALTSEQCTDLAAKIWELESSREPWPIRSERQRIIDENVDWQRHLQSILAHWAGQERYWERQLYLRRMTEQRVLVLELAIRAYQLDMGRLPRVLTDLVPKFLPVVPNDPYAAGPMKYIVANGEYSVYSVGPDRIDDGGKPIDETSNSDKRDCTSAELFPQPVSSQPAATSSP
jgi:hypothetical protein